MATKRKPLPKKLRFEILERDHFTCQYCGAQPADGALHVDHIIPVADGGPTTPENLITSCEPCNTGKGRRSACVAAPDMSEWAEKARARAVEIKRWRSLHAEAERQTTQVVDEIRSQYRLGIPPDVLAHQIREYGIAEVAYAAQCVARKGIPSLNYMNQLGYLRAVLRNRREDQAPPAPMPRINLGHCPFGSSRECPPWEPGDSPCWRADKSVACEHLIDTFGGWDNLQDLLLNDGTYIEAFVRAWRSGSRGLAAFLELSAIGNRPGEAT